MEATYDHSVERESCHGRQTNTLGSGLRIEDLSRDDPAQRSDRRGERVVVDPGGGDETPLRGGVASAVGVRWVDGEQDSGDEEADHVHQVATDQHPSATELVDEEEAAEFAEKGEEAAASLVHECVS